MIFRHQICMTRFNSVEERSTVSKGMKGRLNFTWMTCVFRVLKVINDILHQNMK